MREALGKGKVQALSDLKKSSTTRGGERRSWSPNTKKASSLKKGDSGSGYHKGKGVR